MTTTPPGGEPAAAPGEPRPRPWAAPRRGGRQQLLRPVPGGVRRYVRALATHLPVEAASTGARSSSWSPTPARAPGRGRASSLDPPAALAGPAGHPDLGALRHRPGLPGGLLEHLDLVHCDQRRGAPGAPLVATVHDLAFRHYPDAYPAAERRCHERSARIVADEAAGAGPVGGHRPRPGQHDCTAWTEPGAIHPLGVEVPGRGARPRPGRAAARPRRPRAVPAGRGDPGAAQEPAPAAGRLRRGHPATDHWLVVVGPVGWGPRLRPTWDSVRVKLAGPGRGNSTPSPRSPTASPTRACTRASACRAGGHDHGIPVLTSDHSSLPEVAGDAALLVDPTDRTAIAAGLVRLAGDSDLRRGLVDAGRRRAATFTWRATAAATWSYREVT